MSRGIIRKRRHRRVLIGDMKDLVVVYTRAITPPNQGAFDFTETFSAGVSVKAMVETIEHLEMFDGANLKRAITHQFYFRVIGLTVDKNSQIVWDNRRFEVLDTQDLDDRKEFIQVRCKQLGDSDLETNQ